MPVELATQKNLNVVPQHLDISLDPYRGGGVVQRIETYDRSTDNGPFQPNRIIRFRFNGQVSDFRRGTLGFRANVTRTTGTYGRFSNGIATTIKRAKINFGANYVEDIDQAGLKMIQKSLYLDPQYRSTGGAVQAGFGNQATRDAWAVDLNKHYYLPLSCLSEFFNGVHHLNRVNEQLILEIHLGPVDEVLETDATDASYQIVEPEIHFTVLEMSDQYNDMWKSVMQNKGNVIYSWKACDHYQAVIQNGTNSVQHQLPFRYSDITSLSWIARTQADIVNPAINDKFESYRLQNLFDNTSLKFDTKIIPSDRIRDSIDMYSTLVESLGCEYTKPLQVATNWEGASSYFHYLQTLSLHPLEDSELVAGQNAQKSSTSLIQQIELSGGVGADTQVDYFLNYNALYRINPNGTVTLFQ